MNIGLFSLLFFLLVSSIGFIFALINYKLLNNDEIYQQEEIDVITVNKTAFDVLFDLQSMYGFVKVREIVNSKNLDFIIKWLANDVSIYENLKNQLAEEGVYLCEFKNLNLKLITQDDFDLFNKILGEGSSVSDIIKPGYYDIFKKNLDSNNPMAYDRFLKKLTELKISTKKDLVVERVWVKLADVFVPVIPNFLANAIKSFLFGSETF